MKAQDGVQLQGLLYLPDTASRNGASQAARRLPGAWRPNGPEPRQLRQRGTILCRPRHRSFKPNVRGSTGFGRTFVTLDDQKKRLDSVRDLADMLAFLKTDGRVDADRAAVMGGSYGGYMVNAVVGGLSRCVRRGRLDLWRRQLGQRPRDRFPGLKASDKIEYGDIADPEWKKFYTEISPVNNADKIKIPMLYAHGMMDPRIDISETETMVKALAQERDRRHVHPFPGRGPWLAQAEEPAVLLIARKPRSSRKTSCQMRRSEGRPDARPCSDCGHGTQAHRNRPDRHRDRRPGRFSRAGFRAGRA